MPNLNVQTVDFHGQSIQTFLHNNEPHIVMKSIVEGMGLDWSYQRKKLSGNKARWGVAIIAIPTKGDIQNALCMPLRKLFGWLMTIQPTRLKKDIQQVVIKYQNECDDVLFKYWSGKSQATPYSVNPTDKLTKEQADELRDLIKGTAELLPKSERASFTIQGWSKLKSHFGVPYRQIPQGEYSDALSIVSRHVSYALAQPVPQQSMFHGLRDGRYALLIQDGQTTIKDLGGCSIVDKRFTDALRQNFNTLSKQMRLLSGEASATVLDVPIKALPELQP